MFKYCLKNFQGNIILKPSIVLCLDILVSGLASAIVLLILKLILPEYSFNKIQAIVWIVSSIFASILSFWLGNVYKSIIRYSSLRELGRLCVVCLGKDIILWFAITSLGLMDYQSSLLFGMIIVDLFVTVCTLSLTRILMLYVYDRFKIQDKKTKTIRKILVYGISDKSVAALSRLRYSPHYQIEGFIIYGKKIKSHKLAGLDVCYFTNEDDLTACAKRFAISGILFPYVNDVRNESNRLIPLCRKANISTFIIPGIDEMTEKSGFCNYIRKIKIEDLLGRDEIRISMNEIIDNFNNKVVMVTGAAGSIGSELCRQLAGFGVKRLILFDNAETPLHNIRLELEDKFPELNFSPVIGDVRSLSRLDFVFRKYKPQVVFHAAAYKHVPLMEENPCEAVWVNVCGSRQIADKCVEYGVEKMVMISTDKAVNPTNIMGCTKRLAEIYVQSLGLAIERGEIRGKTMFVTTRFGNVLGSNGSVIPRFREQIEHGGTRYRYPS